MIHGARSVLVVPGHDEQKVRKAHDRGADLVVFDLEDSVPDGLKAKARDLVAHALRPGDVVRVNGVDTEHFDSDILMTTQVNQAGRTVTPMIPKVETRHWQIFPGCILSIESPAAVLDAREIAKHSCGLAFGRYDFMATAGITDIWSPLVDYAMAQVALAAMSSGVEVSDAPCYDLAADSTLLAAEITRARSFGFTSKGCIHPCQIDAVRCGFYPSVAEHAEALATIAAAENSLSPIFTRDRRMAGPPAVKLARKVVKSWR